jgi:transcriptional regulator with XRE-family HTH domain
MRITTQLNQHKLKAIRESKGWTQQKLANEAFANGHSKSTDPVSFVRMYQKIELTGRTSPKRARKIADVLGYELTDLQSIDRIEQLESCKFIATRIKQRIRYLKLSEDNTRLDRIAKIFGCTLEELLGWDKPEEQWQYLDVAIDLVTQIPELMFLGKVSKIHEIYDALSLQDSHFQPATLRDSFWFVYSELNDSLNGIGTLFLGVHRIEQLLNELQKKIRNLFKFSHITTYISRQGAQDRFEIQLDSGSRHYIFECKPCEVDRDKGITWKEPTIWEVGVVRDKLIHIAMNLSDILVIDGEMNPPSSELLCCQITRFTNLNPINYDPKWDLNTKIEKSLKTQVPSWKEIDNRSFFDKYDIAEYLNDVLSGKEKSEFEFQKINAGLELTIVKNIPDRYFHYDDQIEKFIIHLGWNDSEGAFKKAPWAEEKRNQFIELRRTCTELERNDLLCRDFDASAHTQVNSSGDHTNEI